MGQHIKPLRNRYIYILIFFLFFSNIKVVSSIRTAVTEVFFTFPVETHSIESTFSYYIIDIGTSIG